MRISAAQRTENENRVRAVVDRLLRGEIPPGGKCDIKTLASEAAVDRTAFYGTRPYAHLRVEFERRLQAMQDAGEIPDPREAQISRLKAENNKLKERLDRSEQKIEDLTDFRGPALAQLAAQHEEIVRLREAAAGTARVSHLPSPRPSALKLQLSHPVGVRAYVHSQVQADMQRTSLRSPVLKWCPVYGIKHQSEQPVGLFRVVAAGCGQRNPDDKLDQVVGGQVGARRSPPLGLGKKIGCRVQDQPMTVEPQRDRLFNHQRAPQSLVDPGMDEERAQPLRQRLVGGFRGGQRLGQLAQRLDPVPEDRGQQGGAVREVTVQGPRADAGSAGDLVEGRLWSGFSEYFLRRGDETFLVESSIGTPRSSRGDVPVCGRHRPVLRSSSG
ncbi:hypothetical protein P376_0583 [Streptomyces sp. HCCB10043]|nr:hypothetical protein P376_0583 [Streptomyces sp. HCCB10043]